MSFMSGNAKGAQSGFFGSAAKADNAHMAKLAASSNGLEGEGIVQGSFLLCQGINLILIALNHVLCVVIVPHK